MNRRIGIGRIDDWRVVDRRVVNSRIVNRKGGEGTIGAGTIGSRGNLIALGCALLLTFFSLLPAAAGENAKENETVVTQQQARIGGKLVKYTAEVGRIAICDVETGEPHGYMGYTAYRIASMGAPRPVTFIWNGGPGADSSLLHFSVTGPKLAEGAHLVDNPDSWLPVTDLVMVDPIGTGFSRPAKAEYGAEFYGTVGDVASVSEFVRAWRLIHGAEQTPVFLAGESWGAGRAASVAYALEKRGITVNGIVLISGGWALNKSYGSPALQSALRIVDMASAAAYYGKTDYGKTDHGKTDVSKTNSGKTSPELGGDRTAVRQAAEKWVRETYAPALLRIAELSDAERSAIVAGLSRFTGLSPEQIDRKTLIITPRQFRTGLLKDQNKEPYVFDLRRTSAPGKEDAPAILNYFRHELGYHTSLPYIGLEEMEQGFAPSGTYPEAVNARWNYATAKITPEELKAAMEDASKRGDGPPRLGPPLPATEEALALNPHMKVLVAAGMYDSFLPCASGAEIDRQLPPNLHSAITFKCYVGGHAMYLDAATRSEFSRDVEALIEANK